LLTLRIILADHAGQTEQIARWMEEARELLAGDQQATADNQLPLLRRLRFLTMLDKANLSAIDQPTLKQQISEAIEQVRNLFQAATPIEQWQSLAGDLPDLIPTPQPKMVLPSWKLQPATETTAAGSLNTEKKEGE
jgi:hypothetical protein